MPNTLQLSSEIIHKLQQRATREGVSVEDLLDRWLSTPTDLEDRYQTLVEVANDAILTVETELGKIIDVNHATTRLLGYTSDELQMMTGVQIIAPDHIERTTNQWQSQLEMMGEFSVETVWQHKDGTQIPVLVSGKPFELDGKRVFQLIGHDIRHLIETEQARRYSEARYRTLVENFPNGLIALYDHDLRYTVADGEGVVPGLEGKRLRDVFPPDVYERDEPALIAALNGERTESLVDFGDEHFRVITAPVRDTNGHIIGGMVVSQNITALKEAEAKLQNLNHRLELAIETATLGIWELDLKTGDLQWNKQLHDIYGISPEEFTQNVDGWRELIHPEDKAFANAKFEEIATKGQIRDVRFRIIHPKGVVRHILASGTAIYDDAGNLSKLMGINLDVTDISQVNRQLAESQGRLLSLIETNSAYIIRTDADGYYTYVNPIFFEHFASHLYDSVDELLGTHSLETVIPQDHNEIIEIVVACMENPGQPHQTTLRKPRATGEIVHNVWEFVAIEDDEGKLREVQGIGIDITEQIQAQKALQASQERLETIVNSITDYVWSATIEDDQITYQYYSPVVETITGYPQSYFMTGVDAWLDIIHPDDRPKVEASVDKELQGHIVQHEYRIVRPDGEVRWLSGTTSPTIDDKGNILQISGVVSDVTDRKHAEQSKRLHEERFRAAVDASLDAFYLMESVRDEAGAITDFRITEVNDNAVKQLGLPREQLVGGLICELFPINRKEGFFDQYKQVALTGEPLEQEFYIPEDDIAPGWYHQQVVKVGDGIAIMTRDITDRKNSQQLIIENERMTTQFKKEQERNALIQRIISTLSHDLRTPLAIITSSSDMLSRHYDKLSEERRQEKFNTIERQIQFATKLLQDTVDLARGKRKGGNRFNPKPTNLATLCQVSVQEVGAAYDGNHHMQFVNIGDVEIVSVDETLVSRILLNLLSNAIKYTPDEGDIRLELDQEGEWVILRVIDTGSGISDDDLPRIFDPFYRAMDALQVDGTGLGLSIVRDCVDDHHGRINVTSEVGFGTTFIVELPLNVEV